MTGGPFFPCLARTLLCFQPLEIPREPWVGTPPIASVKYLRSMLDWSWKISVLLVNMYLLFYCQHSVCLMTVSSFLLKTPYTGVRNNLQNKIVPNSHCKYLETLPASYKSPVYSPMFHPMSMPSLSGLSSHTWQVNTVLGKNPAQDKCNVFPEKMQPLFCPLTWFQTNFYWKTKWDWL